MSLSDSHSYHMKQNGPVGLERKTAVVTKIAVLWGVTSLNEKFRGFSHYPRLGKAA